MGKIVIVDDELPVREVCHEALSRLGHDVITLSRGDQVPPILSTEKPDLILIDLNMPGESGLSLLRKLREKSRQVPVAIYSGCVTSEIEKEAFSLGATEVILKGGSIHEFTGRVERVLEAKYKVFGESPRLKQTKVLIVDDEEAVRKLVLEFFKRKNLNAIAASRGEEALLMMEKEKPSVVLLDLMMPGMDGLLTLKKIKAMDPDVGVVIATGVADDQLVKEALALGAYQYVLKPFDLQYLELVVLSRLSFATCSEL